MIIALAHAGDIEGAHNHRHRILEYGGTLSADGVVLQDEGKQLLAVFRQLRCSYWRLLEGRRR